MTFSTAMSQARLHSLASRLPRSQRWRKMQWKTVWRYSRLRYFGFFW